MTRWKITIEYKGSNYSGWQRQKNVPTIQESIENALYKFCWQNITLHGSGRTDAGVHARGQVAHFDLDYRDRAGKPRDITGFDLSKALNAHLLPEPITIISAQEVDENFHARFSAKNKIYHYRIIRRSGFLALDKGMAWAVKRDLDIRAMKGAAKILIGHHDFTTFRDSQCQAGSPMKTLDRLDVTCCDYDHCGATEILIEASARSFLHHQVRNMVGSLVLAGEGKWSIDDMREALKAKDRTKGGPTAPAEGLYLMKVDY